MNIDTVYLFPKEQWSKRNIVDLFKTIAVTVDTKKLRLGLYFIVLIIDQEIDLRSIKSKNKIIVVKYNPIEQVCKKIGFIIQNEVVEEFYVENDIKKLSWDIRSFGYELKRVSDFKTSLLNLKNGCHESSKFEINSFYIEDILDNKDVPDHVKKLLLDALAIRVADSDLQLIVSLNLNRMDYSKNYTLYYGIILSSTFLIRAVIEKLIQLTAVLDPAIDFRSLSSSKSLKRSFIKKAENSDYVLTNELLQFISNIELLDDNYRTPEAHKMSRLTSLLNHNPDETFHSLINEILGYKNWTLTFLQRICEILKKV